MGSKLGWILAAVLAIVVLGAILKVIYLPSPSGPTRATLKKGVFDPPALAVSVARAVGYEPSESGNAADDYHEALQQYKKNQSQIDEFLAKRKEFMEGCYLPTPDVMEAVKRIAARVAAGAKKREMKYTFVYTPKELEVGYVYPPARGFGDLDACLKGLLNYYVFSKETDKAIEVLKSGVVMGWHMTGEKTMLHMVRRGLGVQVPMLNSLHDLIRMRDGRRSDTAGGVSEYLAAVEALRDWYATKHKIVWSASPEAGDIFNVIENDKDRPCRIQAILSLGLLRHGGAGRGDKRKTQQLIEEYAASDDPLFAAAAKAARDMTLKEYNQIATRDLYR